MYLLTRLNKHSDQRHVVKDYERAKTLAREHVGQHYPVDSCSSEPREHEHAPSQTFTVIRSTSFGPREASVRPITVVT
jgi:hypothetical protein